MSSRAMRRYATTVVAAVSMIWYTVAVSRYQYHKVLAWSYYPPLIGAVICKLLFPAGTPSPELPRCMATLRRRFEVFLPSFKCHILRRGYQIVSSLLHKDSHNRLIWPTILFVVLPCATYLLHRIITCDHINPKSFANHIGILAVIASSTLLYPVSRFSIFVRAFNLSEINAIKIHIYAGVLAMFGGAVHGIYYAVRWILERKSIEELFPLTGDCWTTLFEDTNMDGDDKLSHCCCKFVNLSGVIAGAAFVVLGLASLWKVRRMYYRSFYNIHVTMSIIALLCMVIHWRGTIVFIAPGLLYYTASNVPVVAQGLHKSIWLKGVQITNVVCIPHSGGCIELSMQQFISSGGTSPVTLKSSAVSTIGKYVRLAVPEVSAKSHPFTFFTAPQRPKDEITILFRPVGPFTGKLARRIRETGETESDQTLPKMLVDGICHGTTNQLKDASRHKTIIIIAGGVGIVSFLSLIIALQSRGTGESSNPEKPKSIQVHWITRDEGLSDHVMHNYFAPLIRDKQCTPLSITVHNTNTDAQRVEDTFKARPKVLGSSPSASALPNSLFDNSYPTFLKGNVLPTATMASIIFGGMSIVRHNYPKRYLASKPIALFEIFGWAVLVSVLSLALVKLGEIVESKLKLYTKIMDSDTINDLEFAESQAPHEHPIITDDESPLDLTPVSSIMGPTQVVTQKKGRPDMRKILAGTLSSDIEEDEERDTGIFMCGPTSMMNAVCDAINETSFQATVYPETFEM